MMTLERTDDGKTRGVCSYAADGLDGRTVFEIYTYVDEAAGRLAVLLLYARALKVLPSFDAGTAWQAADRAITEVFPGTDQKPIRSRSSLSAKVIWTHLSSEQLRSSLATDIAIALAAKFDGYLHSPDAPPITQSSAA